MNRIRKRLVDAHNIRPASSAATHTPGGVKVDIMAVRARQDERRQRVEEKRVIDYGHPWDYAR